MPEQVEQTHRDIINKLSVLEYVIGFQEYRIYEQAKEFSSGDVISLQKEASSMLTFLRMEKYTAVVSYSSVATNTAGHIELNNYDDSPNVFITIASRYKGDDKAVLCIMAHEICHKLLHIRRFRGQTTDENEIYTDLAAIYSGFGKLILNGCYREDVNTQVRFEGITMHTTKRTTTQTIGYMSQENYAYAYAIMSSFYGIKKREFLRGLDSDAHYLVGEVSVPHLTRRWFDFKIDTLNKKYRALFDKIDSKPIKVRANRFALQERMRKYSYADDVRSEKGFSKPVTAYSLILEPILWRELLGLPGNSDQR